MEHYNRDDFETNNTGRDLYNRTSRYSSRAPKRKDFVVSFIASAIVGSALGLYYKNKVYKKTDELRDKERDLRNKVLDYKEQAENTVNSVREKVEDFRNRSKDGLTSEELQAQKVAIQREVNDNNLADQSPEAQEIQEAKLEATKDDFDQEQGPSASELTAQQNAIQEETELADQSPEAQNIQDAKAETQQQSGPTASELAAQQNAIQEETKLADQSPEAQDIQEAKAETQQQNGPSTSELTAQQNAIQEETELADQSPEAQNIQEAKNDAKAKDSQENAHIDSDKKPSAEEIAIAQTAVKKESSDNNLADPTTKEGKNEDTASHTQAEKMAVAAQTKNDKINNDSQVAKNTKDLTTEQDIPKSSNKEVPNLVTKDQKEKTSSNEGSFANRLATAAKTKKSKLTKGSKEAQLTEALLAEPTIKKGKKKTNVPNLVTQSNKQSSNAKQKDTTQKGTSIQSQSSATFENGVVTHEKSTKGSQKSKNTGNKTNATNKKKNTNKKTTNKKQSNTPKQNNRNQKQQTQSDNNQQKVEKANSKIEKRTFND